jgi:hypothetical protein
VTYASLPTRRALLGAALVAPAAFVVLPEGGADAAPRPPAARTLAEQIRFGAYAWNLPYTQGVLDDLQNTVQARVSISSYFYGPGDVFPAAPETANASGGRDLLVAWEIGKFRYSEWTAGLHDAYLDQIAAAARSYPGVVYVRPWPEMNGDWNAFQPTPAGEKEFGGTPAEFIAAWRYVVDYLRAGGATRFRWVFNPTTDTYEGTTDIRTIYPGDAWVDVLGLDGYNWGNPSSWGWGPWRTFEDIYRAQYDRIAALHPTAPVWICEIGCKEPSYDDGAPRIGSASKGRWITDMFGSTTFPRVRAVCWFNGLKERDWRVNSSSEALKAMRTALDRMPV